MGSRSRTQLAKGLAIGLQQFSDALSDALKRKEDRKEREEYRKAMAAERAADDKRRSDEHADLQRERQRDNERQDEYLRLAQEKEKRISGDDDSLSPDEQWLKNTGMSERAIKRRVRSHLKAGITDPAVMLQKDMEGQAVRKKVGELPAGLRATVFKDRKADESVDVTIQDIEDARTEMMTKLIGDSSDRKGLDRLEKIIAPEAERRGWTISSYEDVLDEVRGVHERQTKAKMDAAARPTPAGEGVRVESGEAEPQVPWGGQPQAQVPDSKDGRIIDHVSELMAKRLSRDPTTALMAGHELRKNGYPTPVSPFDMIDPQTGAPSPELLQAAQTDPELGSMLQQYTQMQQQQMGAQPGAQPMQQGGGMQPQAQTQQSQPGPEPVRGRPPQGSNPALFQGQKRPKTPGDVEKSFEAGQLGRRYPRGTTVRRR